MKLKTVRRAKTDATMTATVEFGGESMAIAFRPAAMSPSTIQALRSGDEDRAVDAIAGYLYETLTEWELKEDDEGDTLPIELDVLRGLPFDFLMAMMQAMTAQVQVPKATTNGSFTG